MKNKTINILIFVISFIFILSIGSMAKAADPQFLVTWKANTYAPVWYYGKSLPVEDSSVLVSFELISQEKGSIGKIIDVSDKEVRWYINNKQVRRSDGLRRLNISNSMISDSEIDVRIAVEYNSVSEGRTYYPETILSIPIKEPKIVIENISNSNSNFISAGSSMSFRAIPFFFNTTLSNLAPSWIIDHRRVANENNFDIVINLGSTLPRSGIISISSFIKNIINQKITSSPTRNLQSN